jgi:rod shape-determining protein MreB
LVAVNRDGTRILAVGRQALEMVGRAPDTIQVVRPMREGVIEVLKRNQSYLR